LESNSMIYAAHILDPRCKASMIKDMMPAQFDQIIDDVKHYFKTEWPAAAGQDVNSSLWSYLAVAERTLLPCAAAEADVKRLFSGCRDEYGIRRHALHSNTVRVLTLLRSNYQSEDK
ncbi:hypothetical protein DL98DRAFT_386856, partial [Cadophora sp. DSE1049]